MTMEINLQMKKGDIDEDKFWLIQVELPIQVAILLRSNNSVIVMNGYAKIAAKQIIQKKILSLIH
jgi:hypothetical protein